MVVCSMLCITLNEGYEGKDFVMAYVLCDSKVLNG